jgi:hypothetical protein
MATLTVQNIWNNHPYPDTPCDHGAFPNQCAIRMGVALRGAGADLSTFGGAFCYPGMKHTPRHVLRAQELANWLEAQVMLVGSVTKHANASSGDFVSKQGIVFIQDGWGATDHIDVWRNGFMKGGDPGYFARGRAVWFWELP